jgi:hypothetical protein
MYVCIYVCMYDCRRCATCASSSRRATRRTFHCSSGLTSDAFRCFCAWCGTISKKETRPNASQVLPHLLYVCRHACMYVCMWIDSFRYCSVGLAVLAHFACISAASLELLFQEEGVRGSLASVLLFLLRSTSRPELTAAVLKTVAAVRHPAKFTLLTVHTFINSDDEPSLYINIRVHAYVSFKILFLLVQVLDCDEQQATATGSIFPPTVFSDFAAAG